MDTKVIVAENSGSPRKLIEVIAKQHASDRQQRTFSEFKEENGLLVSRGAVKFTDKATNAVTTVEVVLIIGDMSIGKKISIVAPEVPNHFLNSYSFSYPHLRVTIGRMDFSGCANTDEKEEGKTSEQLEAERLQHIANSFLRQTLLPLPEKAFTPKTSTRSSKKLHKIPRDRMYESTAYL